jgi:hypothetical protein
LSKATTRHIILIAIVAGIVAGTIEEVPAGEILGGLPETQGGSTVVGGNPPSPLPSRNNDTGAAGSDPNPSPNVIAVSKVFRTLDPISMTYLVGNSGGTTEYLFSDTVFNPAKTGLIIVSTSNSERR